MTRQLGNGTSEYTHSSNIESSSSDREEEQEIESEEEVSNALDSNEEESETEHTVGVCSGYLLGSYPVRRSGDRRTYVLPSMGFTTSTRSGDRRTYRTAYRGVGIGNCKSSVNIFLDKLLG